MCTLMTFQKKGGGVRREEGGEEKNHGVIKIEMCTKECKTKWEISESRKLKETVCFLPFF